MVHAGVAIHDIGTAYIDPDKYADNLSIVAFWPSCYIVSLSGHMGTPDKLLQPIIKRS